jgi:NAD(P)H-nitrite reductase large subunit
MRKGKNEARDPIICFCNEVPRSTIERAIDCGACTLAQVYDATWAGCGPCGGTCQPNVVRVLRERLEANAARRVSNG